MVKRKEEKSDGLEIISIGELYTGPWDKKYWSSSRGKDRYPYPIGYNATRTQNGVTYKMEIHEGLNGPLFTISSTDGQSCSGQTPDIAWESFQKRGYQIKLLHGKRFSCKIDGVEFFGFKNTFVQRLLRELVTNISGAPEQKLLSSISLRNEASEAVNRTEDTGSITDTNLLTHSPIPQISRKRNRKGRSNNLKSAANSSLKKPRRLSENCDIKVLSSGQQEHGEHPTPISAVKGSCNSSGGLQEPESLQIIIEREKALLPVVESYNRDDCLKVDSLSSQGGRTHLNPGTEILLEESTELVKDGKQFGRSKILEEQVIKNQMVKEKDGEPPVKSETERINDPNLWAPDTLDHPPDDSFNLAEEIVKDGLAAVTTTGPDSLIVDSHTETQRSSDPTLWAPDTLDPPPEIVKDGLAAVTTTIPDSLIVDSHPETQRTNDPNLWAPDTLDHPPETVKDGLAAVTTTGPDSLIVDSHPETQRSNDPNLWAPDTLDHPPEILKDGLAAVTTTVSDSLRVDSHPERETDTSRLEANSQRSDSDSAGHDIANSMMTLLLPRALPLLRTYTRKKKNDIKSPKTSTCNSQDENKKIDLKLDSTSVSELDEDSLFRQKKEKTNSPVRGYVPSAACFLSESVVPDSLDNAEGGYTPSQGLAHILQVAEVAKENQNIPGLQHCRDEIKGPSKNDNLEATLSVCNDETGIERANDFLPSTKFVQASKKEISGTQRTGVIVSGGLTDIPPSAESMMQQVSFHESVICSDFKDVSVPETCANINAMQTSHFLQESSLNQHPAEQSISANEHRVDRRALNSHTKESFTCTSGTPNMTSRSQNKEKDWMLNHIQTSKFLDSAATKSESKLTGPLLHKQNEKINFSADATEKKDNIKNVKLEAEEDLETESEQSGVLKLIGGYAHPMPVSSVFLGIQGNDLYICVLCGQPLHEDRTIFMYKASIAGQKRGCPSSIGHVSISFLFSEGAFDKNIELDSAALQLTPIGQSLVLFNSVKAPSCREGDIRCRCSSCASNLFEENAVKIVQIRNGYVSPVTKLKTTQRVCCILVCPPDHLVAVEESGKLYIWVMNSKWSAETEEYCLLPPDCPPFCSMKLKRVPNFASLVVGYNGFGEFSLWDITKRMLVSKCSASSTSVFQCLPLSLFRWQKKFIVPDGVTGETIDEIIDATRMSFLEMSDSRNFCSLEDKDVAIWLLISTAPDPNQPVCRLSVQQSDPVHWWRLALLANNTMIMGNSLDPRATTIGFSAGCGIIGRSDGLVYTWEVTTGRKLQNLHHFKGEAVSCIATDDSSHRAVAIASEGGQLLVYLRS